MLNGEQTITECIESLLAVDYPEQLCEIVIVDNGSTDQTAELIKAKPGVSYAYEPKRGVSYARNRGIAESSGEIVAFLDGDCVVDPSWLSELVAPFEDPGVGCVAGELDHHPATTAAERQAVRMLGRWQRFAISSDPPYVVTANAAFRREVLDEIGGFDPDLPRAQDVDIGLRFHHRSPLRLAFSPNAVARHRHRPTQAGFFSQQFGWAYGAGLVEAKNRALEGRRNDPPQLRSIGVQVHGIALVLRERAFGRGRPEHLEDAWYGLVRQVASYSGGWAGLIRGSRIWPSDLTSPKPPPDA